ncbi:MAG: hypothetical protein AMJ42_00890 [Deltaproteobacteria bacterium DG_8]|nr:MAG: hypothetical protein AMJ42_00890 [Deltaproteobacteria bacterium DG_8]
MVNYVNRTTLCLILLFLILGSITMMIFLKSRGVEKKRENLQLVKNELPPKISTEVKEVIAKNDKTISEVSQKISNVSPTEGSIQTEKVKTDELEEKREDDTKTLAKRDQDKTMSNTEIDTKKKVKENIFTSDLDEILDLEVFKDDRENESSSSEGERVALKMSPKVVQEEIRILYRKRMEALTYLE